MNAKERRHVARLEAKIRLLEEQRDQVLDVQRELMSVVVDLKLRIADHEDMAREILEGPP